MSLTTTLPPILSFLCPCLAALFLVFFSFACLAMPFPVLFCFISDLLKYYLGWYIRLVDFEKKQSFAAIFGDVLPQGVAYTIQQRMIMPLLGRVLIFSFNRCKYGHSACVHWRAAWPKTSHRGRTVKLSQDQKAITSRFPFSIV
jgi:hypothetical protein